MGSESHGPHSTNTVLGSLTKADIACHVNAQPPAVVGFARGSYHMAPFRHVLSPRPFIDLTEFSMSIKCLSCGPEVTVLWQRQMGPNKGPM